MSGQEAPDARTARWHARLRDASEVDGRWSRGRRPPRADGDAVGSDADPTETFAGSPAALRHTSEDGAGEGDPRSDAKARRVPESAERATRGDAANAASSTRRDAGDARESKRAASARTPRARPPDIARPEEWRTPRVHLSRPRRRRHHRRRRRARAAPQLSVMISISITHRRRPVVRHLRWRRSRARTRRRCAVA